MPCPSLRSLLIRGSVLFALGRAAPVPVVLGQPATADSIEAQLRFSDQFYQFHTAIRDALGPPSWFADGRRLIQWFGGGSTAGTWLLVDPGARTVVPIIEPDSLQAQVDRLLGQVTAPPPFRLGRVSPDQGGLVFRQGDQGFRLDLRDRRLTALAATDPTLSALDDDPWRATVGGHQVLTQDGGFAVVDSNGTVRLERTADSTASWELPERPWSPNGRFVAVWRKDTRGVNRVPIVDYRSAVEQVRFVPVAKAGAPIARLSLHVGDPIGGRLTQVNLPDTSGYGWLAAWRPNGGEALLLWLTRDGKRLDLLAVAPATGAVRFVYREERPTTFVADLGFMLGGWQRQLTLLPDGQHALWLTERSGWRQIHVIGLDDATDRPLTAGAYPVHEVVGATPDGHRVFVMAAPDTLAPYDRQLLRIDMRTGRQTQLTTAAGVHRIELSPTGRWLVDGHSSTSRPRQWTAGSTDGGAFTYASADTAGLAELRRRSPEPFTAVAADGRTRIHGVLFKPSDFRLDRRYPVIDYIYGGPFEAIVPGTFVGNTMSRIAEAIAQMGFVVVVVDGRGTPGRSKAFQDATYGRVGQLEIADQVAAIRQAASTRPFMDLSRVGIYGHSWGGYFALRAMLLAGEFFMSGYAAAPGALDDDAMVNEPNLGLPALNPEGYAAGANPPLADRLRGTLRLMHGSSDTDASFSNTMRMTDALIRAGKTFELLVMPGEGHNPEGVMGQYYDDDVRRFFVRTLGRPTAP